MTVIKTFLKIISNAFMKKEIPHQLVHQTLSQVHWEIQIEQVLDALALLQLED